MKNRWERVVSIYLKSQRAAGGGIAVWMFLLNGLLRVCLNISSEPMKVVSGKDEKILFGKKSVEAAENIEENGSETVYELLNGGILVLT